MCEWKRLESDSNPGEEHAIWKVPGGKVTIVASNLAALIAIECLLRDGTACADKDKRNAELEAALVVVASASPHAMVGSVIETVRAVLR